MFAQRSVLRRHAASRLRSLPVFRDLPDAVLAGLDRHGTELRVAAGTRLVAEHEHGQQAFIVLDGIAEVSVGGIPISSVSSGDLVGELSVLDGQPRTATVVALTPMQILVLDPRQFRDLFADPQTALWIATCLAQRLREVSAAARRTGLAATA